MNGSRSELIFESPSIKKLSTIRAPETIPAKRVDGRMKLSSKARVLNSKVFANRDRNGRKNSIGVRSNPKALEGITRLNHAMSRIAAIMVKKANNRPQ